MATPAVNETYFEKLREERPEYESALIIWREKLSPVLAEMEETRKRVVRRAYMRTGLTAGVIIAIIIALGFFAGFEVIFPFGIFAGVLLAFLISAVVWIPVFAMKSQTKQLVVGAACEPFGFRYDTLHTDMEGVSDFRSLGTWIKANRSSVFKTKEEAPTPAFDRLKGAGLMPGYDNRKFEDLIEGRRAGADFTLVECKLTQEQGSGKDKRTVTTFQGLLLNIEYPERFLGRTLIARQGWWKRGKGAGDLQKVQLVSKELEDAFTVYSTDQVEARTLLTPDRMERLIALDEPKAAAARRYF